MGERTKDAAWDPARYGRFGDERGRPFRDLMARVPAPHPPDPAIRQRFSRNPGKLKILRKVRHDPSPSTSYL